jgi:hypothetical protein
MDWLRAPPNGFDETTHTLCWDGDTSGGTSGDQDEEGLVILLREHACGSLRHLHVRCGWLLTSLLRSQESHPALCLLCQLKRSRF